MGNFFDPIYVDCMYRCMMGVLPKLWSKLLDHPLVADCIMAQSPTFYVALEPDG